MKFWCPVDDELFIFPEAAPTQEINGCGQLALHDRGLLFGDKLVNHRP
jgi:hypothetical protein